MLRTRLSPLSPRGTHRHLIASPEIAIDLDIPSSPTTDDSASIPHTPTTLSPDPNPVVVEPTSLPEISENVVAENEPFVLSGEEFGLLRTPSIGKMSTRFNNGKDHGTIETTQVVESVEEEKESTPEPVTVSEAIQDVEIPKQDPLPSEKSTPLEDSTSPPQDLIVEAAKEDTTPTHQPSESSPPQTPIKKILKPSGIPRKSLTLDSQNPPKTPPQPPTPPIISELQASVQRRLERRVYHHKIAYPTLTRLANNSSNTVCLFSSVTQEAGGERKDLD